MLSATNSPLKVALLSISPHNRAILEFFFAGAGKKIFTTVAPEQAEALIVDFDHPGTRQEWQDQIGVSLKPAIVLSVKEITEEHTTWVPKPLTSQALAGAAQKIRQMLPEPEAAIPGPEKQSAKHDISSLRALLDVQTQDAQPFGLSRQNIRKAPSAPAAIPAPNVTGTLHSSFPDRAEDRANAGGNHSSAEVTERVSVTDDNLLRTEDVYIPPPLKEEDIAEEVEKPKFGENADDDPIRLEQRWNRLCGTEEQRVYARDWHESTLLYTPENYLLNSLVDALKLSQQSKQYVQVKVDTQEYILLMPDVNLIYSSIDMTSEAFSALCDTPLKTGRVQLHLPSTAELSVLEEVVQRSAELTYDMESLIWTTSLLTSRGRLSRNADLNQPLRLKHWPNLTRLEQFPHAMQIAAIWQQRSGTVFDVSDWLDIPQRYVLAFYNASHTLNLFVVDRGKPKPKEKAAPKKNRGLFSRLLKRLLGGGSK